MSQEGLPFGTGRPGGQSSPVRTRARESVSPRGRGVPSRPPIASRSGTAERRQIPTSLRNAIHGQARTRSSCAPHDVVPSKEQPDNGTAEEKRLSDRSNDRRGRDRDRDVERVRENEERESERDGVPQCVCQEEDPKLVGLA